MSKREFLAQLRKGLAGLPKRGIEERLAFYSEMIDDRIEEGLSEEEAVDEIGSVNDIVSQIVADIPRPVTVKDKTTHKKRLRAWEIILLVLGSPVWLSLLIVVFAVIFSLYASLWAVIISLWAVFASVIGCAFGTVAAGVGFVLDGNGLIGLAMIGAGMVCAGLSVFLSYGCKAATKGILMLTKKFAVWIKNCITEKEEA